VQEKHGSIPVVMFSSQVESETEAQSRGATGFVGKPFDPQTLVDRAKQILPV
jgi:CheY-like chemotaxis protein